MKIALELQSETLADVRAELEAFLASEPPMAIDVTAPTATAEPVADTAPTGTTQTSPRRKTKGPSTEPRSADATDAAVATPGAADVAQGAVAADTATRPPSPASQGRQSRSAADIALGLDADDDADTEGENGYAEISEDPRQPNVEQLLADKAQLSFDFDRVLALQGRAAALGIVQSVLPPGTKIKVKDIEALPVALIPAAIVALQAARVD